MNIKLIVLGTIAYFITAQVIGAITGMFVHGEGGLLEATYKSYAAMWRPELNETPPNLGALMPLWITTGLINSLIVAITFSLIRPALQGGVIAQGLKYGVIASLFMAGLYGMYFGIFALPGSLWLAWGLEGLVMCCVGGIVLAAVADKFAAEPAI